MILEVRQKYIIVRIQNFAKLRDNCMLTEYNNCKQGLSRLLYLLRTITVRRRYPSPIRPSTLIGCES